MNAEERIWHAKYRAGLQAATAENDANTTMKEEATTCACAEIAAECARWAAEKAAKALKTCGSSSTPEEAEAAEAAEEAAQESFRWTKRARWAAAQVGWAEANAKEASRQARLARKAAQVAEEEADQSYNLEVKRHAQCAREAADAATLAAARTQDAAEDARETLSERRLGDAKQNTEKSAGEVNHHYASANTHRAAAEAIAEADHAQQAAADDWSPEMTEHTEQAILAAREASAAADAGDHGRTAIALARVKAHATSIREIAENGKKNN
jgi:hypothetical protein